MSAARFSALVMAGVRPGGDPLARAVGVPTKAFLPIAGVPMLVRVLRTLEQAERIDRVAVVGLDAATIATEPTVAAIAAAGEVEFLPGAATPSRSLLAAVDSWPGRLPLLVTTADHPLLSPAMVDLFCERALDVGGDFAVGLAHAEDVRRAFPAARRTWLRFRGGDYCSCNLFALLAPRARNVPAAWVRVEAERKRPWRLIAELGPISLVRFALGLLTLDAALALASRKIGADARAVMLPDPNVAVDVDRPEDVVLAESILRNRAD